MKCNVNNCLVDYESLSIELSFSILVFPYVVSHFQVVELDFLYPSEGIHWRWDSGHRITATAATPDQAAIVLSVPCSKFPNKTQEVLRTSAFPTQHIKVSSLVSFIFPSSFWNIQFFLHFCDVINLCLH